MIYVAISGWFCAILGWWGAWNVFQNLRLLVQVTTERERKLIQERINMIDNLQAAMEAASKAYDAQKRAAIPNAKGDQGIN